MLSYFTWTAHILLAIQIILFCGLEIFARPKAIEKYTLKEKIKIILLPFKAGLNVMRSEDTGDLLIYRRLWLLIWALFVVRIGLAVAMGFEAHSAPSLS